MGVGNTGGADGDVALVAGTRIGRLTDDMARRADLEDRVRRLVKDFGSYVDAYDRDPAFALAQRTAHDTTIGLRRSAGSVRDAIASPRFVSALHNTLTSWGLGVRGSRLAPLPEFAAALDAAAPAIADLELLRIDVDELPTDIADKIWHVLDALRVADNKAKIVVGTKTLHHLLPDLVPPMDRAWTGNFFRLHAPEWQTHQERTFRRVYDHFVEIARHANPEQYVSGVEWRTSCTKILDNAIIAFCKAERAGSSPVADSRGRRISFNVTGQPPAKSEAQSLLAPGHPHAPRVRRLLESARTAIDNQGFTPASAGRVALELVVRIASNVQTSDATNYLGGVGDVLEDKASRGALGHLGDLAGVWVYRNDGQIKKITYQEVESRLTGYTVTVRLLDERP